MEIEVDEEGFGGEALREGEDCGEVVGLVIFLMGRKGKGLEKWGVWICTCSEGKERERDLHPGGPSNGTIGSTHNLNRTVFMPPSMRMSSANRVSLSRAVSLKIAPGGPASMMKREERSWPL